MPQQSAVAMLRPPTRGASGANESSDTALMAKKLAIADLARLANVNPSTVSRALNDSPLVRQETKEKILTLAKEVGYVMNVSARNLRRQSSEMLGMVIPMRPGSGQTISDPFYLEMVGAVSNAASKKGFDLIISVPQGDGEIAQRRLLETGRADGLLVIGQAGHLHQLNSLGTYSDRIVVWGAKIQGARYTVVGSDNKLGGELAAKHLLGLGRRSILFIGNKSLPEVKLRYEGFCEAHRAFHRSHSSRLLLEEDFGGQSVYSHVRDLAESGVKFDAIFAASDVLAIASIHALRASGKSVPDDVSVVGYDNIGQASMMTPALTTVDQHISLGGEMMVDLLLKKLEGNIVKTRLTPTELIVRQSSVPGSAR